MSQELFYIPLPDLQALFYQAGFFKAGRTGSIIPYSTAEIQL